MEENKTNRLAWLLSTAERFSEIFSSTPEAVYKTIAGAISASDAVVARSSIASDTYPFFIIVKDPVVLMRDIVKAIVAAHAGNTSLNPAFTHTKLIEREFMLDLGGDRICYAVRGTPSNYALKAIACRFAASVLQFDKLRDPESGAPLPDKIKELHPLYDYATNEQKIVAGRKRAFTTEDKQKKNIKQTILAKLLEFVRQTPELAQGVIFVNGIADCATAPMQIIYTEHKYRITITAFLKELVSENKQSSFKCFPHADFAVPYDYRMTKYVSMVVNKATKQATYIVSMYNSATYDPIPCTKDIVDNTFIYMAAPVVRLRMLYIDMYTIQHKVGAANSNAIKFEQTQLTRMVKAFNDLATYDKTPTWVGYYIDEDYDKIKYNMRMKMSNPKITNYI